MEVKKIDFKTLCKAMDKIARALTIQKLKERLPKDAPEEWKTKVASVAYKKLESMVEKAIIEELSRRL